MDKAWDKSGIVFDPSTWEALTSHLLPGAFGMAFASSRGWHRLACAIEDAGLRIHPSIFGWAFGSGFPKATRIKDSGAFEGHRYGLQALKPALEPIIVFQKPYEGKPVESIVETGAGALNIDGGRIPTNGEIVTINTWDDGSKPFGDGAGHPFTGREENKGRWPANFYLGDEEAARRLGEQSGAWTYGGSKTRQTWGQGGSLRDMEPAPGISDTGTASRFFFNVNRVLDEADPVLYCAKASRKERDAGLDCLAKDQNEYRQYSKGRTLVNDEWKETGHKTTPRRNPHPTVKPIDLTRWLATLLLPPAEYAPRRIMVPFSGSGSEMIGAHLAGWEEIVGIEMEQEYVEIAEARLKHWTTNKGFTEEGLLD